MNLRTEIFIVIVFFLEENNANYGKIKYISELDKNKLEFKTRVNCKRRTRG